MNRPKLSILITTCNLGPYVGRALDGVLAQEHKYSFEIIIADDASTDETLECIAGYQQNHPNVIRLIAHKHKVGISQNYLSALEACQGEYVAMLDADDYWTDSQKIKKQIEFLDASPNFTLSCHRYRKYFECENHYDKKLYPPMPPDNTGGFVIDPNLFGEWMTQTLTAIFRRSALDLKELESYPSFKDTHLFFSLLQRGKGYVHGFDGGVYTIRGQGHWGTQNELERWRTDLITIRELKRIYKDNDSLKQAYEVFRFGVWEREYKQLKPAQKNNLFQRSLLRLKMWWFNPYRRPIMFTRHSAS